jgi:hypothetical protein
MGKWFIGIIYLLTGGLLGIGLLYDLWTLNGQVSEINRRAPLMAYEGGYAKMSKMLIPERG